MYKDTKNFVRFCTVCLSRKNAFKIPPAPHQPVEQSKESGETCHMDIFGPLKTTPKAFISQSTNVIRKNSLVNVAHIWHYRVRLRKSGQPIGRLRKTCKNAFPRTIPVSFGRLDTPITTESSLNFLGYYDDVNSDYLWSCDENSVAYVCPWIAFSELIRRPYLWSCDENSVAVLERWGETARSPFIPVTPPNFFSRADSPPRGCLGPKVDTGGWVELCLLVLSGALQISLEMWNRRSNQQPGHCRYITDAGVYRHHGRAADFFGSVAT
ncbi:hypothetical protein TNCV_643621 [Trichonephila clavipes]|nr:hypothetical protein TNCV_643621 [Trichonephila clavipes]